MQRQSLIHLMTATLAIMLVLLLSIVKLCPCTENACVPDGSCAPVSTTHCSCPHHAEGAPVEQEHKHECHHESMAFAAVLNWVKVPLATLCDVFVASYIKVMSLNHETLAVIGESLDPPPLLRSPFVAELKPLLI